MSENTPADIGDNQIFSDEKSLELKSPIPNEAEIVRLRKICVKNLWFNQALAFAIVITTTFLFPLAIFLGFGLYESDTLGIVIFVICGIGGLLIGVANYMFIEERQRRNCMKELIALRKSLRRSNENYRYV